MIIACSAFVSDEQQAAADIVYTYTGNTYSEINDNTPPNGTFTTAMSVSGSFTVTSALAANLMNQQIIPNSFSFSNGRATITNIPSLSDETFQVSTDSSGDIVNWYISLLSPLAISPLVGIESFNTSEFVLDQGSFASGGSSDSGRSRTPGTWTSNSIATPEPASLMLLTLAITMLVIRKLRARRLVLAY